MDIFQVGTIITKSVDKMLDVVSGVWERHDRRVERELDNSNEEARHNRQTELIELEAGLERRKIQLEELLKQNQSNREMEITRLETSIWEERIQFQIETIQRFIEFISEVKPSTHVK